MQLSLTKKTCDNNDREPAWNVLKIYGVKKLLLEGIKALYRETRACLSVEEERHENFDTEAKMKGHIMTVYVVG